VALTYARRYALFKMVGIAGEDDDLDAPPDAINDAGEGHKAVAISPPTTTINSAGNHRDNRALDY
jgi:hypothetical protein